MAHGASSTFLLLSVTSFSIRKPAIWYTLAYNSFQHSEEKDMSRHNVITWHPVFISYDKVIMVGGFVTNSQAAWFIFNIYIFRFGGWSIATLYAFVVSNKNISACYQKGASTDNLLCKLQRKQQTVKTRTKNMNYGDKARSILTISQTTAHNIRSLTVRHWLKHWC